MWQMAPFCTPLPTPQQISEITVVGEAVASAGSQFWEPSLVAQWVKNLPAMKETHRSQV